MGATIAVFSFRGDRIVNERVYLDSASLETQIGRTDLLALAGVAEAPAGKPPAGDEGP